MPSEVSQKGKKKSYINIYIYVYGIQKDSTYEPICMAAMEMHTQRTHFWTQCRKEKVGQTERVAWKYIHCHI